MPTIGLQDYVYSLFILNIVGKQSLETICLLLAYKIKCIVPLYIEYCRKAESRDYMPTIGLQD